MSNHRNDLLDLHPASVVGSLLGARPQHGVVAARDAEPEPYEPRRSALRRLAAALRARRPGARPEVGRV
jgi:hypothetical protein